MKRIFTVLLFVAFFCLSYGQKSTMLVSREIEGYIGSWYGYNENGRLDSMHVLETGYESYRKYVYDDDGNAVREDGYQRMGDKYKQVWHVDYTYDAEGRLLTRMNYNSMGSDDFSLSGKMVWEYDANGNVAFVRTYFPSWTVPDGFDLFSEERYVYDGNGLLTEKETWLTPFSTMDPDEMYRSSNTVYTYDESGRLTLTVNTEYDESTGDKRSAARFCYAYDEDGNLSEYESYIGTNSKTPQVKSIYHYDKNIRSSDVMLPLNFEDSSMPHMFAMTSSVNAITYEEWWQVPNESDDLAHIGDYLYTYESTAGIGRGTLVASAEVNGFISNGKLYFHSLDPGVKIRIYNAAGVEVMSASYSPEGVSLSSLPKGIYLTRADGRKVAFKFMR